MPKPNVLIDDHPALVQLCLHCTRDECPTGSCHEMLSLRTTLSAQAGNGARKNNAFCRSVKRYAYDGGMYTLKQVSAMCGVSYSTLMTRLSRGVPFEQAVQRASDGRLRYKHDVERAAKQCGIPAPTLRYRMRHGMTLQEAMSTPLRGSGGKKKNETEQSGE